jgi:hypothetical protein
VKAIDVGAHQQHGVGSVIIVMAVMAIGLLTRTVTVLWAAIILFVCATVVETQHLQLMTYGVNAPPLAVLIGTTMIICFLAQIVGV